MKVTDVIVVGAGAAGLMAAHVLSRAGRSVTVLEARNRTGGRIHTLEHASFFKQAELGAEFIHGDLPVTLDLLKEAGLEVQPSGGEFWQSRNGTFTQEDFMGGDWDLLMQKLSDQTQDMSLNDFLARNFAEEGFEALCASARRYLTGFDTGDPDKASIFALREEWLHEDDGEQHRVKGGYCGLISYLVQQIRQAGSDIYLNEPVKQLKWSRGEATVTTGFGEQYQAKRVIVALPAGVLQQPRSSAAALSFEPEITAQQQALQQIGFGDIIKILLRFEPLFWKGRLMGGELENMAFLLSKEEIPTWWTQAPQATPLFTGWLGGPPAAALKHLTDQELLQKSLQSLANIYQLDTDELKDNLIAWHVANWSADPYTCGSYAYDTLTSAAARQLLCQGVEDTLFFAGEYLYQGPAMGTVEAALANGRQVADHILQFS